MFDVSGRLDGGSVRLAGTATTTEQVSLGSLSVDLALTPEGHLRGDWTLSSGAGGPIHLFPHGLKPASQASPDALPEQVRTERRELGAMRLYADDVRQLVSAMGDDFVGARVVATYTMEGARGEYTRYADEIVRDFSQLGKIKSLWLAVQVPEVHGIMRGVVVALGPQSNELRVQGVSETWVLGKTEKLHSQLRHCEKRFATTFRKWGLNFNSILLALALLLLPDLELPERIIFLGVIAGLIAATAIAHSRLIPNAVIHVSEKAPGWWERIWPTLLSWTIAFTSALLASLAFALLDGAFGLPAG